MAGIQAKEEWTCLVCGNDWPVTSVAQAKQNYDQGERVHPSVKCSVATLNKQREVSDE